MDQIIDETEDAASENSQDSNAHAFAQIIDQYREGSATSAWVYTDFEHRLLQQVEKMRQNIEYWSGYARKVEHERDALMGRLIHWMTIATAAIVVVFVIFAALAIVIARGGL